MRAQPIVSDGVGRGCRSRKDGWLVFFVGVLGVMELGFWGVGSAKGDVILPLMDGTRVAMQGEGYLQFKTFSGAVTPGEEWTGWVDVRHPAMDGTENVTTPFDRSNQFFGVRAITVTDTNGVSANPDIQRDFDFSSKIYAQAGLSPEHVSSVGLTLDGTGGTPNVAWPINQTDEDDAMKALSRDADVKTINAYYVQSYSGSGPNGLTSQPAGFGGNDPRNDGSGLADQAVSSTFAHEIGHMLLNGPALHMETPGVSAESDDPENFMFKTGSTFTLNDVGMTKGKVEGVQIDRIYDNAGDNNPGFVQFHDGFDDHRYGNQVDWDFIVDHSNLEDRLGGADNHPDFADLLYFEPGAATAGLDSDLHKHDGLGEFDHPGDFLSDTFFTVDVFSLSLRYSDFDRDDSDNLSLVEGALDYDLFFVDETGGTAPGELVEVFVGGWTDNTEADDFLGRWRSPFEATGVLIAAREGEGYDGIAQIDAVIASRLIPEPVGLVWMGLAALTMSGGRRKRRR